MSTLYNFFFFNDTATTEIYTLSLHDALPIWAPCGDRPRGARRGLRRPDGDEGSRRCAQCARRRALHRRGVHALDGRDRKSTRLNSSHANISYAVFCLKKKKHTASDSMYCRSV